MNPHYPVELIESRGAHYYRVDGRDELWPGVTTVLGSAVAKPWLAPWAAKEAANKIKGYLKLNAVGRALSPEEIDTLVDQGRRAHIEKRDAAADVGTRAHKAIDAYILGGKPEITDDIRPAFEAFQRWQDEHPFRVVMGDTKVASVSHRFGGSLDILAESADGVGILDIKTSNQISWEYALQVGGYAIGFEETYGVRPAWGMVLRLSKTTPEFEARPIKNLDDARSYFLIALLMHNALKGDLI